MPRPDEPQQGNPTIGLLRILGPLIPASDCKPCFALLIGLQYGVGALLILPGRRPPPTRGKWMNRAIRAGNILTGSTFCFTASMEVARFTFFAYEPWIEDAKKARQREDMLRRPYSKWDPREWYYMWFGPQNYHACSWNEWRERRVLKFSEQSRLNSDKLLNHHQGVVNANMSVAEDILKQIHHGSFEASDMSVAEMKEQLRLLPDFGDEHEQEVYDEVDLRDTNLWQFFDEEPVIFQSVVMPRSTTAFLDGAQLPRTDEIKSQNVNYMPMPKRVKKF